MSRAAGLLGAVLAIAMVVLDGSCASAQELRIGIIDFYGLHQIAESQVRSVLGFTEGDVIRSGGDARAAAERRLGQLPGVVRARINAVCCDAGRAILYVGIEEEGAATLQFRAAPSGSVRLPDDVVRAGDEFERALMAAVQRGDAEEDDSHGHSLMHDLAARAIQERFIGFAARDRALIHEVVRDSAAPAHRALAAQILGYAADKRTVIDDLTFGMSDPSESVRNDSMRALAVIAGYAARMPDLGIRVSFAPFVGLLNSPVWTDRNKASFALEELSSGRDPDLLATLRAQAVPALIEMVRWKSDGHVAAAFFLLGRVGGLSEDEIQAAWARRDRDTVIRAAAAGR